MRRTFAILAIGAVFGLAAAPAGLGVTPAHAKNPIGKFFGKVGDAITSNPLTKRGKRNKARDPAPVVEEPVFTLQERKLIQSRLNELGYNVGTVDGIFGAGTRSGIARYQASAGADATGRLTQAQADTLLAGASQLQDKAPAGNAVADGGRAPATGQAATEIAGTDAVWTSAAMGNCAAEDWLACMERFGAPQAAIAFARQSGEAGLEPGLLEKFEDFGIVDLAELRYPQLADRQALVLVNGGPAAVSTENDSIRALSLDDPVYRRLVSRYGELKLFEEPRLESHRLETRGGQRFVFAYRLAKCQACATPGEMLVAFDFDATGVYTGLSLLGIADRDPDQDWMTAPAYAAGDLKGDLGLLQRRLAGLGFEPGPLDGKGGKQLKTALTAFQTDHGLNQSGEADEQTADLLASADIIIEISRFEQVYRVAMEGDLVEFALRYGRGILSRAESRPNASNIALARMNGRVARLHDRQKDYASALPFAQKAVAISHAAGQEKSQGHGFLLFNLGETYRQLDRTDEALENFEAAFDLFEPLAVSDPGGSMQNLAAQALEQTGRKLIALYEKLGKSWSARRVKNRLDTVEAKLVAAE